MYHYVVKSQVHHYDAYALMLASCPSIHRNNPGTFWGRYLIWPLMIMDVWQYHAISTLQSLFLLLVLPLLKWSLSLYCPKGVGYPVALKLRKKLDTRFIQNAFRLRTFHGWKWRSVRRMLRVTLRTLDRILMGSLEKVAFEASNDGPFLVSSC